MTNKISKGSLGTDLQVTFMENGAVVDITAVTLIEIELTKPDGTKVLRTGSKLTTGADGIGHYIIVDGDREAPGGELQEGFWTYIGIATFSPTQVFPSIDAPQFEVV